jgi:hypothetical protein
MPAIINLKKDGKEKAFAVPGIALPYMLRNYSESDTFFDPNDSHSEVATILMQDLFTSPGIASRGSGIAVVVKDPETKETKVIGGAYFDPETGMYYTDKSMSTPIDNVIDSFGRDAEAGTDLDIKHFAMGLMLAFSDWDPLTGLGPGNAVVANEEDEDEE